MDTFTIGKHLSFYAIGLSYKKADAEMRGKFSLDENAKSNLLHQAKNDGIESLLVTSTCNRTEIYGFAEHPFQLIKLLCENSNGTVEDFQQVAYVYKNKEALNHMFRVGTGLDSQILGDFEIISQIKQSFNDSKKLGLANSYVERLVNAVIQASKKVKNETDLSSGATSVSFASVQYIMNNVPDIGNKNILLFGTGKIGRNTCENLVKHTKNEHIVLINRTKATAEKVAGKFNLIVKDYADLQLEIQKTDVLVVATGAQNPTVDAEILKLKKPLLILDLSIPKNVDENVKANENNVSSFRKFAPTIHSLKEKLGSIKQIELNYQRKKLENFNEEQAEIISNRIIQKITNHFANHLKNEDTVVDESIEWINKVFQIEAVEK